MDRLNDTHVLKQLDELERAVNTPVVSGELVPWLESVADEVKNVETTVSEYIRTVHPNLYDQIAVDDPELSTCVQQLAEEDHEILQCLHELVALVPRLRDTTDRLEPDERRANTATQNLTEKVIGVVQRIRKQETAIATWCTESLLRDRGAVD